MLLDTKHEVEYYFQRKRELIGQVDEAQLKIEQQEKKLAALKEHKQRLNKQIRKNIDQLISPLFFKHLRLN